MPQYPPRSTVSMGSVHDRISEYTDSSRMRRAINCVYCPPKSMIAILSGASTIRPAPLPRAAELLGLLEDLAFGLDRRRDDQLGLLQLPDVAGAHRAHAGANGADEIERAVLGERRPEEDLLQRPRDAHADPGTTRQVLMWRRHAPVIAAAGRLDRPGERGADHHGVGARGERLAHIAPGGHAAVGDDGDVASCLLVIEVAGGR